MNLDTPLKQQVIEDYPWLLEELGFKVLDDDYQPESFGNSFVTLESPRLRVRLVRDRGQVIANIGSVADRGKWWPLTFVLEAIRGKMPEPNFELDEIASRLRNNLSDLMEAMGPKYSEMKQELERRGAERIRRWRAV